MLLAHRRSMWKELGGFGRIKSFRVACLGRRLCLAPCALFPAAQITVSGDVLCGGLTVLWWARACRVQDGRFRVVSLESGLGYSGFDLLTVMWWCRCCLERCPLVRLCAGKNRDSGVDVPSDPSCNTDQEV